MVFVISSPSMRSGSIFRYGTPRRLRDRLGDGVLVELAARVLGVLEVGGRDDLGGRRVVALRPPGSAPSRRAASARGCAASSRARRSPSPARASRGRRRAGSRAAPRARGANAAPPLPAHPSRPPYRGSIGRKRRRPDPPSATGNRCAGSAAQRSANAFAMRSSASDTRRREVAKLSRTKPSPGVPKLAPSESATFARSRKKRNGEGARRERAAVEPGEVGRLGRVVPHAGERVRDARAPRGRGCRAGSRSPRRARAGRGARRRASPRGRGC